ncbi:hypothetical protein FRC02_001909 [Tulasnella sp. 418]|nr:hypothetical protein FRC02_001909 [Tulasnella sp. 418]
MRLNIFENLTSPVDLSDRQYIEEQRERLVPLSLSPFKPSANGNPLQSDGAVEDSIATHNAIVSHDHLTIVDYHSTVSIDKDVPRGERPPAWLELSLDLAWTASFASLTANTKVEDAKSVSSYAVFFAIMWQLWADQITYDIQFYTNDWFHRLIFISQLGIYAGLSSFTNEFDILWGLKGKTVRYWRSDDDKLEYIRKANLSFDGISCVLAISRGLLIVQYMRGIFRLLLHKELL